ncbi:MAG: fibrobacter succinogenes major paralogous domain-containing protein [Fibromonadaceae bacterium]|jgi:uncharacterized protein (TIGR02145 family)|nr:fibrobacter succinogenes major paralogous domain-containing protein [Fibromonadaceae bacterium]
MKNPILKLLSILLIGGIGVQTIISCSSSEFPDVPPPSADSAQNSSSSEATGKFCVYYVTETCFPTTMPSCALDGVLMDYCPSFEEQSSSSDASSSSVGQSGDSNASSSSVGQSSGSDDSSSSVGQSSSSVASSSSVGQSSGSDDSSSSVGQSSSSVASSSSVEQSSSSAVPSSSSVAPSSSSVSGTSGTFTDSRDSKSYKWVKIGTQTWMAENLNYNVTGSNCYNNQESNCGTYGRLYNWATAMAINTSCNSQLIASCGATVTTPHRGVCPTGWHLPSDAEWTALANFVGTSAGTKLKANSSLWTSNTGTDDYGFSALPGGGIGSSFYNVGYYGLWWSSTELDASYAWLRYMDAGSSGVDRYNYYKAGLFSVRCVKDD